MSEAIPPFPPTPLHGVDTDNYNLSRSYYLYWISCKTEHPEI